LGGEGRSDEAEEELTEGWYWQEPSGLSSSVNTASQPIRWHRTGAAVPLFAASVAVDIAAGALSRVPVARSGKRSKDLDGFRAHGRNKQGAAGQGHPPENGSESIVRAKSVNGSEIDNNTRYFLHSLNCIYE